MISGIQDSASCSLRAAAFCLAFINRCQQLRCRFKDFDLFLARGLGYQASIDSSLSPESTFSRRHPGDSKEVHRVLRCKSAVTFNKVCANAIRRPDQLFSDRVFLKVRPARHSIPSPISNRLKPDEHLQFFDRHIRVAISFSTLSHSRIDTRTPESPNPSVVDRLKPAIPPDLELI